MVVVVCDLFGFATMNLSCYHSLARNKPSMYSCGQVLVPPFTSPFLVAENPGNSASASAATSGSGGKLSKSSFLANLHPSRWGSRAPSDKNASTSTDGRGVSTATLLANHREKIQSWITTHGRSHGARDQQPVLMLSASESVWLELCLRT